ncbi:VOC family protein [Desulfovibrio sp. OttesenSCG-928-M16]|nr:VOC family protein [Desulfovibrio sp. OttesenSCG-928-M16]
MNRINLICLGVRDIKKSLEFYRNIGFKTYEKKDTPPIVFFDTQGTKLELYPLEALVKDINAETPPPLSQSGFCGITLACNMKSKEEVDEAMERVRQHGGVVVKTPQEVFWGGYSGYFQDPDGYYWEVAYAASWKFDANDMLIIEDMD